MLLCLLFSGCLLKMPAFFFNFGYLDLISDMRSGCLIYNFYFQNDNANICSDTRFYRYVCFCHQWHTSGFGQTVRLVRCVCSRFCDGHRRRYDTRPATGRHPGLDDGSHLLDLYRTGLVVGHSLWQASHPSEQYILHIRQYRPGAVHGGRCGQEHRSGLSFLGSHYHGQHYRGCGWCDT